MLKYLMYYVIIESNINFMNSTFSNINFIPLERTDTDVIYFDFINSSIISISNTNFNKVNAIIHLKLVKSHVFVDRTVMKSFQSKSHLLFFKIRSTVESPQGCLQ